MGNDGAVTAPSRSRGATRATRPIRAARAGALLLAGAPLLAGCGSSVPDSPPTGVDLLVVPTPSPDPADFVERIDNPWLAWRPGLVTSYDQTGSAGTSGVGGAGEVVRTTVGSRTTTVAGLVATSLTTSGPEDATTDFFAQDRAGNVWWLGREGVWTAGEDGAEAGLWMPADPRTGDGFRQALQDGVVDDVATVEAAPEPDAPRPTAPDARTTRLDVRSELAPGVLVERTYVAGLGLTEELRTGSDGYRRELTDD